MATPPQSGCVLSLRVFGTNVHFHWTFPILGVGIGWIISSLAETKSTPWSPAVFFSSGLACVLLVLLHEMGHAIVAGLLGLEVHAVFISGTGGWCAFSPARSAATDALAFAGGILAQTFVLALAVSTFALLGPPESPISVGIYMVLIGVNGILIASAAVPHGTNDGAKIVAALRN